MRTGYSSVKSEVICLQNVSEMANTQGQGQLVCEDFLGFQESLAEMRKMDDKIIYTLNTTIPTESFKGQMDPVVMCRDLNEGLLRGYNERTAVIKTCITQTADIVKKAKALKDANEGDPTIHKQFKNEQRKLRLFQQEMNIEDIIRERSLKIFNERCRLFNK